MERVLRRVFSALVGSKYAAAVDGRLTASALIEDCEHITGERRSHEVTVTARPLAEVRQLADQIANAAEALKAAMTEALGAGWELVEDQLRRELGHDISIDPGS